MTTPAVVERQLQVFQHQRRRLAQAVLPDDGRIADADAFLLENPLGKGRVAFALRRHAGHRQLAVEFAAHVQHRAVESQQGQGRAQANQALPGEHAFDTGQRKGRCTLAVGDHHVVEDEIRIQPLPARLDTADAHRLPDRPAGCLLDLGAVIGDLGQHRIAQGEHQGGKGQPGRKQPPGRPAQGTRDARPGQDWPQPVQAVISRRPYVLRNHAGMSAGRLSHRQNRFAFGGNSSLQSGNSENQHSILFGKTADRPSWTPRSIPAGRLLSTIAAT